MSIRPGFYILGFAAVVVLDWVTPLAIADWLIPVCVVCFASIRGSSREATAVAAAGTICVVAGLWSSPLGDIPFWMGALNRVAAVAIIWACVYLARRRRKAESELTALRGLLPICASCRRVRYGDDEWENLEAFISRNSGARFTHGLCPACYEKYAEKGSA